MFVVNFGVSRGVHFEGADVAFTMALQARFEHSYMDRDL